MPMNACDGDALPVSAFNGREDGHFPLGTAAYEKRGVAVSVPVWDAAKCIQCNQCSYVCPHATIRPVLLTDEEAAAAPANFGAVPGKANLTGKISVQDARYLPLDCLGCKQLCKHLSYKLLRWFPLRTQLDEAPNWEYAVALPQKRTQWTNTQLRVHSLKNHYLSSQAHVQVVVKHLTSNL